MVAGHDEVVGRVALEDVQECFQDGQAELLCSGVQEGLVKSEECIDVPHSRTCRIL